MRANVRTVASSQYQAATSDKYGTDRVRPTRGSIADRFDFHRSSTIFQRNVSVKNTNQDLI